MLQTNFHLPLYYENKQGRWKKGGSTESVYERKTSTHRVLTRILPQRIPAPTPVHLPIPRRIVAKGVQRKVVGVAEDRLPERVKAVLDVLTGRVPFLSTATTTTSFLDSGPKARANRFLW